VGLYSQGGIAVFFVFFFFGRVKGGTRILVAVCCIVLHHTLQHTVNQKKLYDEVASVLQCCLLGFFGSVHVSSGSM